ncbi:glycosyltransferase family 2 protein [Amycolatopsis sp. K13G38]|uniref:Glycosyltransferase family 2 protein n=1 Tax=Amycolatopsis acididurans TaxID=2724524 RepID=A0ABX1JCD2_9PSEU|nr:glycosyltransferase family A protein [Amycolatopsis acididurans]NKQ57423.1 glycosyltransferase family 2 protein [Amycolatopsis acididurans]
MTEIDVLVPTCDRPAELAVTLSGLAAQEFADFAVIVADQSEGEPGYDSPAAMAMIRVLERDGHPVRLSRNLPRRGLAQQRAHLLERACARYVLFLDDDVWLERGSLARMHSAITELECGFVGNAVQGLSYMDDFRPHELTPYEEWESRPQPEEVDPESPAWDRWTLHNAANPAHLSDLVAHRPKWTAYKVAWVGGCVLYDRELLLSAGAFDFWRDLPAEHCGEDVLAQTRVMAKYGGAGILPTGAVHLESPTTVTERNLQAYEAV